MSYVLKNPRNNENTYWGLFQGGPAYSWMPSLPYAYRYPDRGSAMSAAVGIGCTEYVKIVRLRKVPEKSRRAELIDELKARVAFLEDQLRAFIDSEYPAVQAREMLEELNIAP